MKTSINLWFLCILGFMATSVVNAQLAEGPSSFLKFSTDYDYGNEYYYDAFTDTDGSIYTVGKSDGPLDGDYSSTKSKLIVHKYNSSGARVWQVVLKDPSLDYYPAQVLNLDSAYILVRYRESRNSNTYHVAKYSKATGQNEWIMPFANSYQNDGFVANGTGKFFRVNGGSYNDSLTTIECYDKSRTLLWSRQVQFEAVFDLWFSAPRTGDDNSEIWFSYPVCHIATNGDFLVGGITKYSSAPNLPSFVRIDASGVEVHQVTKLPNASAGTVFAVTSDPEGNAYVLNYIANSELALTKISRSGVQLWQKKLPNFSDYYFTRPVFVGDYLVLMHDTSTTRVGIYSKDGAFLQGWNLLHEVGDRYSYDINSQGRMVSVGSRSYSGSKRDATMRTRQFQELPVRQISLSGDLSFGAVNLGSTAQRTMSISNTGNSALSVSFISLPEGFSADWTAGTIPANGTRSVKVFFSPTSGASYGGTISVNSDATGGTSAITCSGTGLASAPVITSSLSASGETGQPFSYWITASNGPTSYSATELPSGLFLNAQTGLISGTPASVGSFTISLAASNNGGTGYATLTLTVKEGPPPAPVINSNRSANGRAGQPFSYQITASNGPTSYSATGLPGGLFLNAQTGLISGTPASAGTFAVTVAASNSGGTGSAQLTLTLAEPLSAPAVTSSLSAAGRVGQLFSYQITASNGPTSYSATGLPSGLFLNAQTGLISGTPTSAGTFAVTVAASNSGGTGSAQLTLTLAEPLKEQVVKFKMPKRIRLNKWYKLQARAKSKLPISYFWDNENIAEIVYFETKRGQRKYYFRIFGRGEVTITAWQEGNDVWAPASSNFTYYNYN